MPRYYSTTRKTSQIKIKSGSNINLPDHFLTLSSDLIRKSSFIQILFQQLIYSSHGPNFLTARNSLKEKTSPRDRAELISQLQYEEDDEIVKPAFDYARFLFTDIYKLRNILAHEDWKSSDCFEGHVLFTSLDEEAKILHAKSMFYFDQTVKTKQIYDSTMRYIEKIKLINKSNLEAAIADANLCSWIIMQIDFIVQERDIEKRNQMRQGFLVHIGTSHLFKRHTPSDTKINVISSKHKRVSH